MDYILVWSVTERACKDYRVDKSWLFFHTHFIAPLSHGAQTFLSTNDRLAQFILCMNNDIVRMKDFYLLKYKMVSQRICYP